MARKKAETMENPAVTDSAVVQEAIEKAAEEAAKEAAEKKTAKEEKIPENVLNLMRLYPQYGKIYVTKHGFVHPENAPSYITEGATLYENKFYKQ